jgi:peptide/nickel transport system permease protein
VLAFLTQRLLQIIPTLIIVSMLIFGLQQLLPGDPALIMAGEERDPKVLAEIREQYKLDQPIPVQYLYWVKGVLAGNLGESMRLKSSVARWSREAAGDPAARRHGAADRDRHRHPGRHRLGGEEGDAWDYGANLFALWGLSTPNFWLGILMIFLFSVTLAGCRPRAT